jgi:hypothetical protein
MADALTEQESIVRAAVEQSSPAVPQTDNMKAAERIRKAMDEQNPEKALLSMRIKPIDESRIRASHERNIGMTADPTTGLDARDDATKIRSRKDDENVRYKVVTDETTQINEYLKNFATLERDPDQNEIIKEILPILEARLPFASVIFTGTNKNEIIREIILNPEYAIEVQKLLEERISGSGSEILPQLISKVEEAKRRKEEKEKERTDLSDQITRMGNERNKYEITAGSGSLGDELKGIPSIKQLESIITSAKENEVIYEKKVNDLTRQINLVQPNLYRGNDAQRQEAKELLDGDGKLNDLLNTASEQLKQARDARQAADIQLNRRKEIESQRDVLQAKIDEETERLNKIDIEIVKLDEEFHISRGDLNEARLNLVEIEKDYIKNINNIFGDAAMKLFEDRLRRATEAGNRLLEEDSQAAKDIMEKSFFTSLKNRWDETEKFDSKGRSKGQKPKKPEIITDWKVLVTDGPEALIRSALGPGPATDEKMKDADFVKKATEAMIPQLIQKKMQTFGMTEEEGKFLAHNEWSLDSIKAATERDGNASKRLEEMQSMGIFENKPIKTWIKENPKKLALFLAILAGLVSVATLGLTGVGIAGAGIAIGKGIAVTSPAIW